MSLSKKNSLIHYFYEESLNFYLDAEMNFFKYYNMEDEDEQSNEY